MKRDINFIKHIKPQLKEKEAVDKATRRDTRYRRACEKIGISPYPEVQIEHLGLVAMLLKRIKQREDDTNAQ